MFPLSSDTTFSSGYVFFEIKNDYYMYCGNNLVHVYKDTQMDGNLDVGPSQAQNKVTTHFHHVGSTGYMMMEGRYRDQGFLHFGTNYQYGENCLIAKNTYFIRCSDYAGNPYVQTVQPLTQPSDDKLKENEELIEHACETLSKLRPQLYDKKQIWTMMILQLGIKKVV